MPDITGHIIFHRAPTVCAGVGTPPDGTQKRVNTAKPGILDPRHDAGLTCWCRPLIIPIYDDEEDEVLP